MRCAFLEPSDPRWAALLAAVEHDTYHLPGYVALCAAEEGARATAFWAEDGDAALLIPLLLRPLPEALGAPRGLRDAVSPYGYAAPLLRGAPGARHAALFARFVEEGAREDLVSAFLRLHPLLPLPEPLLPPGATRVERGSTLYVDLRAPWSALEQGMRAAHRYDVRRLERDGFRVRFDAWEDLPHFIALYRATMTRVGAAERYHFFDSYFHGLRRALGEHLHLALVHAPDGAPAAGALFLETCGLVQYHLSGTADAFVRRAPTKLLLHAALRWAQARGATRLHLGGGVGSSRDSLFHFKAGFGGREARFATLQLVLAPHAYAALSQRWCARLPPAAEGGFFPLYRLPAPEGAPAP